MGVVVGGDVAKAQLDAVHPTDRWAIPHNEAGIRHGRQAPALAPVIVVLAGVGWLA